MDNIEVVANNKVRVDLTTGELFLMRAMAQAWQHPREVVDVVVKQTTDALALLGVDGDAGGIVEIDCGTGLEE